MSTSEHGAKTDRHALTEVKVEEYEEDATDHEMPQNLEGKPLNGSTQQIFKRLSLQDGLDGVHSVPNQSHFRKRPKVDDSVQDGSAESPRSHSLESSPQDRIISSYRKPLYGISHRITEKKATSSSGPHESGVCVSHNGTHFPKLGNRLDPVLHVDTSKSPVPSDSQLYPLFEKMFFILNTLNSSMTQLHSKVDLLSLEVTRIKKQIQAPEMTMKFKPPPEYLLTREELVQLMEETQTAGELGCRLLVQLFPELFTAKECAHGCQACGVASKPSLDSLHLQLVRNYVESCYPLIKNETLWQNDCLLQINDFFNRFWAQKDMEGGTGCSKQSGFDLDQNLSCRFLSEDGQDEGLSLDSGENGTSGRQLVKSDLAFDHLETGENFPPDDITSLDEFVVFLLNRIFPEVFEEGRLPEGHSDVSQLIVSSDRLGIIRKYMEAHFPEVPEETWLQLCIQRMDAFFENGNGGDQASAQEEMYNAVSLPDDATMVKIGDYYNYEKASRRSKRSWPGLVDFGKMEIPFPDFEVPQEYLFTKEQLRSIYESCVSIGNFATRLLVLMFPELFTQENTRKQYNCSGSLGKKQLDPVRINLIRHYVQLLYPKAKTDRVWASEFVVKLDERCRRRDTEQRRSCQQSWKTYSSDHDSDLRDHSQIRFDRPKEDLETPSLPPEKSSKDFCKVPLEELKVSVPDFPVPSSYILLDSDIREIVQQSLSVGNFASRLLVRLFPELFTPENLRLQYNHSGACNKKQLDPVRLRLIRHYVEAVYPVDKVEEVWHYECIPSIDERCRRPNRKKCDILKKPKRSNSSVSWP